MLKKLFLLPLAVCATLSVPAATNEVYISSHTLRSETASAPAIKKSSFNFVGDIANNSISNKGSSYRKIDSTHIFYSQLSYGGSTYRSLNNVLEYKTTFNHKDYVNVYLCDTPIISTLDDISLGEGGADGTTSFGVEYSTTKTTEATIEASIKVSAGVGCPGGYGSVTASVSAGVSAGTTHGTTNSISFDFDIVGDTTLNYSGIMVPYNYQFILKVFKWDAGFLGIGSKFNETNYLFTYTNVIKQVRVVY